MRPTMFGALAALASGLDLGPFGFSDHQKAIPKWRRMGYATYADYCKRGTTNKPMPPDQPISVPRPGRTPLNAEERVEVIRELARIHGVPEMAEVLTASDVELAS